MWCSLRTRACLVALAAAACAEVRVAGNVDPTPDFLGGSGSGGGSTDSGDSAEDTGVPADADTAPGPEHCTTATRTADDALPLSLDASLSIASAFDQTFASDPDHPGRAWISTVLHWESSSITGDGAYWLERSDWDTAQIPADRAPEITGPSVPGDTVGLWAVGQTNDPGAAGEALWLTQYASATWDGYGRDFLLSTYDLPASVDAATAVIEREVGYPTHFADFDADGITDAFSPEGGSLHLGPFAGTRSDADADAWLPDALAGVAGQVRYDEGTAIDLDGDGILDWAWRQYDTDEWGVTTRPVFAMAGPLTSGGAWRTIDATVLDDCPFPSHAHIYGPRSGSPYDAVYAAGDLTGDGREDATTGCVDEEADTRTVIVLDAMPTGTRSLSELPMRVVGTLPGEAIPFGVGLPGDLDGDGFTDLLVRQDGRYHEGEVARSYMVSGPLDGGVDLDAATPTIEMMGSDACMGGRTFETHVIHDIDGDGADDIIVSQAEGDSPSIAWLFESCVDPPR